MGISRPLVMAMAVALLIAVAGATAEEQEPLLAADAVAGAVEAALGEVETAALRAELGQLRAKISALASLKTQQLIHVQAKGSVAAEEQANKANAKVVELEKQVDKIKKDIEAQSSQKAALEYRANDAEKKVEVLNEKLNTIQKESDEKKRKIKKTERALKVAEVHGAWLPPWLMAQYARYAEVVSGHWNQHGKPAVQNVLHKASEKSAQAKKWAEPHIETAKMKWIPVKQKLVFLKKNAEPYVQKVSTRSVEFYESSRDAVTPHAVKVKVFVHSYYQKIKKFSKPYIDQIAEITKPHVEKIRTTLKPYTKRAVHAYGSFLKSATTYHRQASALLALPVFIIYRLLVGTFCSKKNKRPRSSNGNHGHKRYKRRHADK
ncbi:hypothetical protein Zm00014a_028359 [Zea mays]|uniref:Myosin heavy chain-related n=1 Tax=Zea mays TaxID=4577 RepID=A0A317Y8I0_MAIZE|nr:hypothetical protein Zm00014a_028359 [Zea mays]